LGASEHATPAAVRCYQPCLLLSQILAVAKDSIKWRIETFSVRYPNYILKRLIEFCLVYVPLIKKLDDLLFSDLNLRICHVLDKLSIIESKSKISQMLHQIVLERPIRDKHLILATNFLTIFNEGYISSKFGKVARVLK
jgi:hypothetical protein